jgi:hypothetical protein
MLRVDPEKVGPSRPVDSVSMRLESFQIDYSIRQLRQ